MPEPEPPRFGRIAEELIGDLRGIPSAEPARQVRRPTKTLTEEVTALMEKFQIGIQSPEHTIRDHWRDVVGAANAAYSHPALIDPRGKLTVLVKHAVVRNELFLHRETILERIRALPACGGVKGLNIRAG